MIVGRRTQISMLNQLIKSDRSAFLAVTGRRRVGKTFLIDTVYSNHICFRMTGIQDGSMQQQLINFAAKLAEYSGAPFVAPSNNWQEAFMHLKSYLQSLPTNKKLVLFFDETPWISTAKSGFLQLMAHFWNDYLSKETHFILVVCGSATSWIITKIVRDRGGLHNRITQNIHLQPFSLEETREFFLLKKIDFTNQSVALIYMAMGGIPYYLEHIRKGESPAKAIDRLCFSDSGILKSEYQNLYKALFRDATDHEAIVRVLSESNQGLSRSEIINKSKVKSGGPYNRAMADLLVTGFVSERSPFGRKKRGSRYHLIDEYSIFYHRFIKRHPKYTKDIWIQISASQPYKIWCGLAFETLCFKHIQKIKDALGIASVYTEYSSLNIMSNKTRKGFQIDLIIDRNDHAINLCEIKFYADRFVIDKEYALQLISKKQFFLDYTQTKKQLFITLITNHGVTDNAYAKEVMDAEIKLDELF